MSEALMLKLLAEFLATAIFLGVIFKSSGDAVQIGVALIAVIYLFGSISGCHVNPAITITSVINNQMSMNDGCLYVLAQLCGGLAAYAFVQHSNKVIGN